jgi:hypothetical protein
MLILFKFLASRLHCNSWLLGPSAGLSMFLYVVHGNKNVILLDPISYSKLNVEFILIYIVF